GDAGFHTFSGGVTLTTAGTRSLAVADTVTGTVNGAATVTVVPGAVTHFSVSGPVSATAGGAFSVTVLALDQYGNRATGFRGTVHFSSSDPLTLLPANYSFTAGDNGTHTFTNGVTLKTAGSQTVTVGDTGVGTVQGSTTVTVAPNVAAFFEVA